MRFVEILIPKGKTETICIRLCLRNYLLISKVTGRQPKIQIRFVESEESN